MFKSKSCFGGFLFATMKSPDVLFAPESPVLTSSMNASTSQNNPTAGQRAENEYMMYVLNDRTEKTWVGPHKRDPSAPHNSFCEICNKNEACVSYGKNSILNCGYCNVVVHLKCMKRYKKNFIRPKTGTWMCYYCKDSIDESKGTFEYEKRRAERIRRQIMAQITIARYFRKYVARKYFITIYTVIIKLQIMFRVRKRKKQFLLLRQSKLRSIKVKINTCIDLIPREKVSPTSAASVAAAASVIKQKKDNYFYILVTGGFVL